jgi:hypothetical protein
MFEKHMPLAPTNVPTASPTASPTCAAEIRDTGKLLLIACVVLCQIFIFFLMRCLLTRSARKTTVVPNEAIGKSLVESIKQDKEKICNIKQDKVVPRHLDRIRSKLHAASYAYCTGKQTKADILRFLDHQDTNHTGTVDYEEFSHMVRKRVKLSKTEMDLLCVYLDVDKDQCIHIDEFVNFLNVPYDGYHKRAPTEYHEAIEVRQSEIREGLK